MTRTSSAPTPGSAPKPVLACYDGSEGSRHALRSGAEILGPRPIVILTVWQSVATLLARAGFGGLTGIQNDARADREEEQAARQAALDGAARAQAHGFDASPRVEQAGVAIWRTIIEVADEIDAELILCGTRGRGAVESALLGSTSHAALLHAHRPVLIAPEPRHAG